MIDAIAPSAAGKRAPSIAVSAQHVMDVSFECPHYLEVSARDDLPMEVSISLGVRTRAITADAFEVIVSFHDHAKRGGRTAFIAELVYAGIFTLTGFSPDALDPFLHIEAPELLFPFMRKIINRLLIANGINEFFDQADFVDLYNRGRRHKSPEIG